MRLLLDTCTFLWLAGGGSLSPAAAAAVLAEIRKRTAQPVRYVVLSHWHWDHWYGAEVYKAAFPGVKIVAHEKTRAMMAGPAIEFNRPGLEGGLPGYVKALEQKVDVAQAADPQDASIAALRALEELGGLSPSSVSVVAGHSLGEYSALVAAGALRFADARGIMYDIRGKEQAELPVQNMIYPPAAAFDPLLEVLQEWKVAEDAFGEETGAAVVGPLCLIGELDEQRVHMASGDARIEERNGQRALVERHNHSGKRVEDIQHWLRREPSEVVEFHTLLARTSLFARLGPLDEGLLNTREHVDFCLRVRAAGEGIYFEPRSVMTSE